MFGQEAVAEKVDTMTAIMTQKLTCDDVVSMEFSYAPPLSSVIDPIAQAASQCLEKIDELNEESSEEKVEEVSEEVQDEIKEEVSEDEVSEEVQEESKEEDSNNDSEDAKSFTQTLRDQGLIQ